MKRNIFAISFASALLISTSASAEPNHHTAGMQFDVGVPDGVALGVAVRPVVSWLRLDASFTYNAMSPGGRLGATLDPVNYWVSPTLTLEGGFAGKGKVPGLDKSPDVGYEYVNIHAGLDFGKRNNWRLFIHAGPTYMAVNTSNVGQFVNPSDHSITFADPSVTAWLLPTVKIGFTAFFF